MNFVALISIIVVVAFIIISVYFLRNKANPLMVSGVIGLILVVINSIAYGILGALPAILILDALSISGEDSWGLMIVVGDIGLFVISLLVGWFINKRLKSQKTV